MFWSKVVTVYRRIVLLGLAVYFISLVSESNVKQGTSSLSLSQNGTASETWTPYDPDPNHIWNRLYRSFYRRESRSGREYGYDELDPLLWSQTKYLLTNPSNRQALAVLDEFLSAHGERAIDDPLKRAILQRDLWAILDWTTECLDCTRQSQTTSPERLNLQNRLAEVMKRLALSPDQIAALPNTYKQAIGAKAFAPSYDSRKRDQSFLPPDLFDPKGPWVAVSIRGGDLIAPEHVRAFSGRSVFLVFIRLPDGRNSTLDYLKTLSAFPKPWILDPETRRPLPNPELPEFPSGTELALVRLMALIDTEGEFRPTNIVEDIQIRVHRAIPSEIPNALNTDMNEARGALDVYEFKLSRAKLFANVNGGLRPVAKGEKEFPLFRSHGMDLFEENSGGFPLDRMLRVSLEACASCHFRPGIHSMLSRERPETLAFPERTVLLPSWDLNYEANGTKRWKGRQYNWGLLQGLWNSQPVGHKE